jgi:hypothetical protein
LTARTHGDRRDDRDYEFTSTRTSLEAWFGLLGGPASGFLLVLVNYPVVDRACVTNSSIWLHVVQAIFLGIALLSGFTSWRLHGRAGEREGAGRGLMPRIRFMTTVGLLTSALAVIEIVFQWIPIFFIGACHGT